jgi:hypothetical protein
MPSMSGAESKAAGFNSTVSMLREMCTPEQLAAVLSALPPETADLVRTPPLPVTWIPNRHVRILQSTAVRVAFDGNVRKMVDLSRRARLADLGTIYRYFVRLASAQFAIERAAKMYTTYTRNNGSLTVTATGKRFAELTFKDISEPSPAAWAYYEGAIQAVVEMTGLKTASVLTVRGGGREPDCVFRVTWNE